MPISAAAGSAITVNPSVVNADGSNTLKSRLKGKSEAAKKVPSFSARYKFGTNYSPWCCLFDSLTRLSKDSLVSSRPNFLFWILILDVITACSVSFICQIL